MRVGLKLAFLGLLSLLSACATAPVDQNVKACEPLPVADCLTLLKQKGLQPEAVDNTLVDVAIGHLQHHRSDVALDYLNVLTKRDDKSALTHRKLGDAFSLLASQEQTVDGDLNVLLSGANYMIASVNYMLASTKDPSDQMNYIDAGRTAIQAGACEIAESMRSEHEKRFGKNDRQRELAAIVHQKCG